MSASAMQLMEPLSSEAASKRTSKKVKSMPSKDSGIECDSQRVEVFQGNLHKLVPHSESDELSERTNSSDEEEITDAETDMKIILDALQKEEKIKRNLNKTFNDDKLKEIERRNSLLMEKILAHNKRPSQYNVQLANNPKITSAAINRKRAQKKIDHDNLILLRKIQTVKPFGLSRPK